MLMCRGIPVLAASVLGRCASFALLCCFEVRLLHALGQLIPFQFLVEELLNLPEEGHVRRADEGYSLAVAVGAGRSANAVNVILGIARHVVVYDHSDVVNVYAAREDVGSHEHVNLSALEAIHYLVALCLFEVGVHLAAVYFHPLQGRIDLLYGLFLA